MAFDFQSAYLIINLLLFARLPQVDYAQLVANYEEVIRIHNNMLHALEEMMGSKSGTPRFGRVFLSQAPHLKTVHIQYCSSHPKAITIVEKYR